MLATIEKLELVMWEKVDMPESIYNKDKKIFEKTGKTTERTQYTLRDEFGDKLVFIGDNSFRDLERERVSLQVKLSYDEFARRIKVSLNSISSSK